MGTGAAYAPNTTLPPGNLLPFNNIYPFPVQGQPVVISIRPPTDFYVFWGDANGGPIGNVQSVIYDNPRKLIFILLVNTVSASEVINGYIAFVQPYTPLNTYTCSFLFSRWTPTTGLGFTKLNVMQLFSINNDGNLARPEGNLALSGDGDGYFYMMMQSIDSLGVSLAGYSEINDGIISTWNTTQLSTGWTVIRMDFIQLSLDVALLGTVRFPDSTSTTTVASSTCYLGQYFAKSSLNTATYPGVSYNFPYYPNMTNFVIINQNLVFIYMINVQAIFCSDTTITPPTGSNVLISITNYNITQVQLENKIPVSSMTYLLYFGSDFNTMTHQPDSTLFYFTSDDGTTVHKYDYTTETLITQPYATVMSYSPQYTYGLCDGKVQSTFLDTSYNSDFSFTCPAANGYYYQSPNEPWHSADPACINMSPDELMTSCPSLTTKYNALVSSTCPASYSKLCTASSLNNPPYSCTKILPANALQALSSAFASTHAAFYLLTLLIVFALRRYYGKSLFLATDYLRSAPADTVTVSSKESG